MIRSYNLSIKGETEISEILEKVKDNFKGLNYAIDEFGDTIDSVKWYGHEEDMIDLSLNFPEIIFDLYAEGEESDDIWHKYFKNGKRQFCKANITFDEYDESKLE